MKVLFETDFVKQERDSETVALVFFGLGVGQFIGYALMAWGMYMIQNLSGVNFWRENFFQFFCEKMLKNIGGLFLAGKLYDIWTGFGVVGERLTTMLRVDVFKALLSQDIAFFDEPNHNSVILSAKLESDCSKVYVKYSKVHALQ